MLLILDNYDSFTYNLFQCVTQQGWAATVIRNDSLTVREIENRKFAAVIISPGPGRPDEAGVTKELIGRLAGKVPLLGVCLGHQAIAEVFGAKVVQAPEPFHGKVSKMIHDGKTVYKGLTNPLVVGRYHSLTVEEASLPSCLEVTARTEDGLIMGLRHRQLAVEGVQFHPESILTASGPDIIRNFLDRALGEGGRKDG